MSQYYVRIFLSRSRAGKGVNLRVLTFNIPLLHGLLALVDVLLDEDLKLWVAPGSAGKTLGAEFHENLGEEIIYALDYFMAII